MRGSAREALDDVHALVRFTRRPSLTLAAARVPWRLAMLITVLSRFRGQSARVDHLHIVHWSLSTRTTRALMKVWLAGTRPMDTATARIDPALDTTLAIALARGLVVVQANKKIALSLQGRALADELDQQADLFTIERQFLKEIGPLTSAGLERMLGAVVG